MRNRLDPDRKGARGVIVRKAERVIKELVNFRVMFYGTFLAFPLWIQCKERVKNRRVRQ